MTFLATLPLHNMNNYGTTIPSSQVPDVNSDSLLRGEEGYFLIIGESYERQCEENY